MMGEWKGPTVKKEERKEGQSRLRQLRERERRTLEQWKRRRNRERRTLSNSTWRKAFNKGDNPKRKVWHPKTNHPKNSVQQKPPESRHEEDSVT